MCVYVCVYNYYFLRNLIEGVKCQIDRERSDKIREREKENKFRRKNRNILDSELPSIIGDNSDSRDDESPLGRQVSSHNSHLYNEYITHKYTHTLGM